MIVARHQVNPYYLLWKFIRHRVEVTNCPIEDEWRQHPIGFISYVYDYLGPIPSQTSRITLLIPDKGYVKANICWDR